MVNWVLKGLNTGIKTSLYPRGQDEAAGLTPGRPVGTNLELMNKAEALVERCPTGAITRDEKNMAIDYRLCIHCSQCRRNSVETAEHLGNGLRMGRVCGRCASGPPKVGQGLWSVAIHSICRCRCLRRLHERSAATG